MCSLKKKTKNPNLQRKRGRERTCSGAKERSLPDLTEATDILSSREEKETLPKKKRKTNKSRERKKR